MPFSNTARPEVLKTLSDVKHIPFWLDDPDKPQPAPELTSATSADLVVIGGGFTGLWTALLAKEEDSSRDVVLLEGDEIASGASGRNGGFMDASITHGFENALDRWSHEVSKLFDLGIENLNGIEETIKCYNIECDYLRVGELIAATEPYQIKDLQATSQRAAQYNQNYEWLDQDQARALVNSPIYLGGLFNPYVAMINPAQLAWGLRRACLGLGVRLFERTQVTGLEKEANGILISTAHGHVRARKVALATNAFPPLIKKISQFIVPVYDYVLMTEPLSKEQRAAIGWQTRIGAADAGNQFHYYRMTADDRILWGGYDAIYYRNNAVSLQLEDNPASFARLADHFFVTFPQLEGLRFTHAWGGVIDTCSRFNVFWGTEFDGDLAYAMGYTGLGVGATRFGARIILDLLDNKETERTSLKMVRTKPFPFPPEPLRSLVIKITQWSLMRADQNQGRRNLWLRLLDLFGLGFDS